MGPLVEGTGKWGFGGVGSSRAVVGGGEGGAGDVVDMGSCRGEERGEE